MIQVQRPIHIHKLLPSPAGVFNQEGIVLAELFWSVQVKHNRRDGNFIAHRIAKDVRVDSCGDEIIYSQKKRKQTTMLEGCTTKKTNQVIQHYIKIMWSILSSTH